MKLPNNFGSISRLSGNRRNPYMVRKNGIIVGYYNNYADALMALCELNREYEPRPMFTIKQLFDKWYLTKIDTVKQSTLNGYHNAYAYLLPIHAISIEKLKYSDFQSVIDSMNTNYASKKKVKSLIIQLLDYAIKHEYDVKQYGTLLTIGKHIPIHPHKPISRRMINKLWNQGTESYGALVLLYTGMRVGELLNLRKKDINLKSKYLIVTESKTDAGRNRLIPIHPKIMPIIEQLYPASHDRLFPFTYSQFAQSFKRLTGNKHSTHDCRHTVASLLDSAGANPAAIRAILGHKHGDITTRVYTHKTIRDLKKAINLLK